MSAQTPPATTDPPPSGLTIFISRKTTDDRLAKELETAFTLYAGTSVQVRHAGKLAGGSDWQRDIEDWISTSDWCVLLHTDPDENFANCTYECGRFIAAPTAPGRRARRMVTLCRDFERTESMLKKFQARHADVNGILSLLQDLYIGEGVNPKVTAEQLKREAVSLNALFAKNAPREDEFAVVPTIVVELRASQEASLMKGAIPDDAKVTGTLKWHAAFNWEVDTGAYTWKEIRSRLRYPWIDEYLWAGAMRSALALEPSDSIPIRPVGSASSYRARVRKLGRLAIDEGLLRFHFSLTPMESEIDMVGAQDDVGTFWRLANASLYFRRRVIEGIYTEFRRSILLPRTSRAWPEIMKGLDALVMEIMRALSLSIVRDLGKTVELNRELGVDVAKDSERFMELLSIVTTEAAKVSGPGTEDSLVRVDQAVSEMEQMNRRFLLAASRALGDALASGFAAPAREQAEQARAEQPQP